MIRTITPYFVIASCAMHLFCCGIPLFLSITSLAATFGISSLSVFEIEWFEAVESYVLIGSGIILAISLVMHHYAKKVDCMETGYCDHPPCGEKKQTSNRLLYIAAVLYCFNIITVLVA